MKLNRFFKTGVAAASAAALTVGMLPVSALASVSYDAPTSGMEADDDKYLSGATAAANTVVLSLLGINVTSSDGAGLYQASGSSSSYGTDSSNLGIFGSDINDNPDPYIYNFFYNLYSTQTGGSTYSESDYAAWTATPYSLIWGSNKSGPTGQASGTTSITVGGVTKTTNPAFYYEPDILLGGGSNGYATELANYQADYNEDYNPTIFLGYGTGSGNYAASGTRSDGLGLEYNQFDMTKGVVYLGSVVQNLMNETGQVNRYDQGTYEIGVNYDKYDRGLYYYVLSEIADGSLTQVRYASSLSYDSDTGYFVSQGTGRNAQYASGIGIDIYDLLEDGYEFSDGTVVEASTVTSSGGQGGPSGGSSTSTGYYLTTNQLIEILNAPTAENAAATGVIIGSSLSNVDTENDDLANAGIRSLSSLPSCVYGMTMQTVENGMGIPFYIGFFYYNQDSSLNPVSYIYYWMENFYHVSDTDAMDLVINNMLADSDLPAALSLSGSHASSYSATEIEAQITAGIKYYQTVLEPEYDAMVASGEIESDSALYWTTLDTSVGIGSDIRDTNANYSCISGDYTEDSYGNLIYSFTYVEDTGALESLVASVNALNTDDYTDASYSALDESLLETLNETLAAAEAVLADESATQYDINKALSDLTNALNAVIAELEAVDADKAELLQAYTECVLLSAGSDSYTAESWAAVEDAMANALTVLNNNSALISEVTAATAALNDAVSALVEAEQEIYSGDTLAIRSNNTFYLYDNLGDDSYSVEFTYGRVGDEILIGDWDGDGVEEICLRRGNVYYIQEELGSDENVTRFTYGRDSDEVLVGDWDNDGVDELAVRRGNIYYYQSELGSDEGVTRTTYGRSEDEILVGDWDGNGSDEFAVRRNGTTYYFQSVLGSDDDTTRVSGLGTASDTVLVGDWDNNGSDELAIRRGTTILLQETCTDTTLATSFRMSQATSTNDVFVIKWN